MSEAVARNYIPWVAQVEGANFVGYVSDPFGEWISATINGNFVRLFQYQDDNRDFVGVYGDERPWFAVFDRNPSDPRYLEHTRVGHGTPWDALEYLGSWSAYIDGLIASGASEAEIKAAQTPPPAEEWTMPEDEDMEVPQTEAVEVA